MITVLLFIAAFAGMEAVSYASHRWVMHGFGMGWHRSHHAPPAGRLERNDLFPLTFSVVGIALFALAASGADLLWPVAAGVTAYGATYLFVHEVHIHHRLPITTPAGGYLGRLRRAHADHHRSGGEPYGMLLPIGHGREDEGSDQPSLDRVDRADRAARSASSPPSRARL